MIKIECNDKEKNELVIPNATLMVFFIRFRNGKVWLEACPFGITL